MPLKLLLSCLLFVLTLLAVNWAHFSLLPVDVVFYGALQDTAIAIVIAGLISWYGIFRRQVAPLVFFQQLVIFALLGYVFAITVPTVIDRSYSIYLLEKLQQYDGRLKQSAFDHAVTEEFMREHRLSDVRLTEQLESGTIRIENGCVVLTQRGQQVASFARWYRQHMLPGKRLLMGHYSDALTDPFRQPSQLGRFRCP